MMIRSARLFFALTAVLFTGQALAVTYNEIPDAGETLATAQAVPDGIDTITGWVGLYADLFQFNWGGGAFSADTLGSALDTQLFLFDSAGNGIWGNDDGGPGLLSLITDAGLAAGTYYIGISAWDNDPMDSGNNLIFPTFPFADLFGPNGGVGPLDHWSGATSNQGATFYINFNRATGVPEPGTLLLLGAGLLGLGLFRRKTAR